MKDFSDILADMRKYLLFKNLAGISRPSSSLVLEFMDAESEDEDLFPVLNGHKTILLAEHFKYVSQKLCDGPAVPVRSGIKPRNFLNTELLEEIFLANLGYVEWLDVDGRKYLALVDSVTHPFGTTKEMAPVDAQARRMALLNPEIWKPGLRQTGRIVLQ